MKSNPEQRQSTRFEHQAAITLEGLPVGNLNFGKMFNFSNNGVYFESDYLLKPGTEIYLGIQNSPFAADRGVYECYRAVVRRRRSLKRSMYYYGYGVELIEARKKDPESAGSAAAEGRRSPRKKCRIPLKFSDENKIHRGLAENISSGGVYIKTEAPIAVGRRLILAIPLVGKGRVVKRPARVVWHNENGLGVKFEPKPSR
jgi:Tfp pilus assembly protein PilZ